jgi:3-oxosteroid 1-dehydrogenase
VFGDPNCSVGPLQEAPYHGVRLTQTSSALGATGFVIDERARVLDEDNQVIEKLYATGNATAYRDLGHFYHSGTANARNMTWAYIAATDAAGASELRESAAA